MREEHPIRELMNADLHKMSIESTSPVSSVRQAIEQLRNHRGLITPDGVEIMHPEEYRRRVERGEIVPPQA